jgi:hypothetical protein
MNGYIMKYNVKKTKNAYNTHRRAQTCIQTVPLIILDPVLRKYVGVFNKF